MNNPIEFEREEVAIVGMAGRFPGAADITQFWQNLVSGVGAIRPFTPEELAAAGESAERVADPAYVNAGAPLADADRFDATFFGLTPRQAQLIDPQHRILLEVAWHALEDAGYAPNAIAMPVAVYGGVAANSYREHVLAQHQDLLQRAGRYSTLIAGEREYAITRISYQLDLRGPAVSVNTACSTSGVAIHLACQSLLNGECDMALAGGARVHVPLTAGYRYTQNGILSPDGVCRAFDKDAAGTVIGSGAAMVVLRRLSDALRDNDAIYAIIKGTAINNDGADKVGYTAPSVRGQAAVIDEALAVAEVDPGTIGLVEAHGTATTLGDPIEVAALTEAYRRYTDGQGYCAIGSLKTNVGHLDAAAGVAGVIKAALALRHGCIPPSLNFKEPNPRIDFANSPFFVVAQARPWPRQQTPRRAAVSSFGLGGTNAHIILQEAQPRPQPVEQQRPQLLLLAGRDERAVNAGAVRLAERLSSDPNLRLTDVAATLAQGRAALAVRHYVIAADRQQAVAQLQQPASPVKVAASEAPIHFMFAGGGAQHARMLADLYEAQPIFRSAVDECARLLADLIDVDLRDLILGDHADLLQRPRYGLPALLAVQIAQARLWASWGIEPAALIGHSMGEYAAAHLAGVFSLADALAIVAKRGELFETLPPGAMSSVMLDAERLAQLCADDDLAIAAANHPQRCVVSGAEDAVAALEKRLVAADIPFSRLQIAVAAHSPLVESILPPFAEFLQSIQFQQPQLPFISNLSGDWISPAEAMSPDYWVRHLRQTVRFADGLACLLKRQPHQILLEVGPGQNLTSLARRHPALDGSSQHVIPSARHPRRSQNDLEGMLQALGQLWQLGVPVDWPNHFNGEWQRVSLPGYPFERRRHWVDADVAPAAAVAVPAVTSATPQPATSLAAAPEPAAPALATAVPTTAVPAAPVPATPVAATAVPQLSNRDQIAANIRAVLYELSGIEPHEIEGGATFLELGFDSLLLTQANTLLAQRLGVPITFRQLFEEAPTVNQLTAYVESRLGDRPPPPAPAPQPQLQPVAASVNDTPAAPQSQAPAKRPTGPWKPIDTGRSSGLTPTQQRALDRLIAEIERKTPKSKQWVQQQRAHLADPRSIAGFRSVWKELIYPVVADRSDGPFVWDIDGNRYVDVAMGFGVAMFGHKPAFLQRAVSEQLEKGFEIGPQHPLAGSAAERIARMTGHQRVAFCNTGSEAVLAAIRTTRTVSGKPKIVMFVGDYHGIFDEVLARRVTVRGEDRTLPAAPGIRPQMVDDVILLDYGDHRSLAKIRAQAGEIAAVLVEPVQSRHPDLQPREFLRALRKLTDELDVALIFDEMITGFRIAPGGAQEYFGVQADVACYGKAVAGGIPIGVVAGIPRYLDALDGGYWQFGDDSVPEVGVTWFAGTFVRHPFALAAADAVMRHLESEGPALQMQLNLNAQRFVRTVNAHCKAVAAPLHVQGFSSFFLVTFDDGQQYSTLFYQYLRNRGVHITEGRAAYISTAHSESDVDFLIDAYCGAIDDMQRGGFLPPNPNAVRTAPLSHGQLGIWLAAQRDADANRSYNISNRLLLQGPLDVTRLQRALQQLVQRHDALRTTFSADGEQQRIAPSLQIDLRRSDLSHLDPQRQRVQLAKMRSDEMSDGFDLEQGPLLRTRLIRLGDARHELWLTAHHIVVDGWSSGVLMRELGLLYQQRNLARTLQLADFVDWQAQQEQTPAFAEALDFWKQHLGEQPPYLDLPTDRPRPPFKTSRAGRYEQAVAGDMLPQLRKLGARQSATLFATLLASFQSFLYRISGQDDIVLGLGAAGQPQIGSDTLVGHCVNLLPLRTHLDGDQPFDLLLRSVRTQLLNAFEHQQVTFSQIVRELGLPRDPARIPLVSVSFNLDPTMGGVDFGSDLNVSTHANPKQFENFDIFFNFIVADQLRIECTYNRDLFDEATIKRWIGNYEVLLARLIAQPGTRIDELPLLTEAEAQQLRQWNANDINFEAPPQLHLMVAQQAAQTPQNIAWVYEEASLTYRELDQKANSLAWRLQQAGVNQERPLAILLDRGLETGIAALAVLKAGSSYLPIASDYPPGRISFMLDDSEASLLITTERLRDELLPDGYSGDILLLPAAADIDLRADAPAASQQPHDLAFMIYTSGSTGRPKAAQIEHGAICNFANWYVRHFELTSADNMLFNAPFGFDAAVWEIFVPLISGGRVVVARQGGNRDPDYITRLIAAQCVTHAFIVPTQLRMLVEQERLSRCSSMRIICCGGETFPEDLAGDFRRLLPHTAIHNVYGPTETTILAATWNTAQPAFGDVTPIGYAADNTTLHVLNKAGRSCPIGVGGELYIGGRQVGRGYWRRPELSAERFVTLPDVAAGKLYRTGDLVRRNRDGSISFIGRVDHQVKLRGRRIELGEIEARLNDHVQINHAAIVVHAAGSSDERLVAYYEATHALSDAELRRHLNHTLPYYMIPSHFVIVAQLPLTPNGKVDRRALAQRPLVEPAAAPQSPAPALVVEQVTAVDHHALVKRNGNGHYPAAGAPLSQTERQLLQLWRAALQSDELGVDDDFFAFGGHSLLAVRLFGKIEALTGHKLPLSLLTQAPTVAQLARHMQQQSAPAKFNSLVAIKAEGAKTPFFHVGAYMESILAFRPLGRHFDRDRPLYGLQPRGLDGGQPPHTSIEQMGADYLAELRQVQPFGPYLLGGHCAGAWVAFAMAHQLQQQGEQVQLLALVDSAPPHVTPPQRATFAYPLQRAGYYLRERRLLHALVWQYRVAIESRLTYKFGNDQTRRIEVMRQAQREAYASYAPPRDYRGRVLFLRSSEYAGDRLRNWHLRWLELTSGPTAVAVIDSTHATLLHEPQVQRLSHQLRSHLDAVENNALEALSAAAP